MGIDKKNEGKIRVDIIVLFFLIVIFCVLLFVYINKKKSQKNDSLLLDPSIELVITPQPPIPLPTGKQVFNSSYGDADNTKPKLGYIAIDPLNSAIGTAHKLTFSVTSTYPITRVEATVISDSKKTVLSPNIIKGTSTNSEWEASWVQSDTINTTYNIQFRITNSRATRDDDIVFR